MRKKKIDNSYTISIDEAGGPIQLHFFNNKSNSGIRLLGGKGSPYTTVVKQWVLTKQEVKELLKEIRRCL